MECLGDVEANVGDRIAGQADHGGQHDLLRELLAAGLREHVDAEETRHAYEIVLVARHVEHLGYDGVLGPLVAELLDELLEVVGCGLANREHVVEQPVGVQVVELLVEELDAELAGEQRHVLDDGEAHAPLGVLGELHYRRQQRLRQRLHADHLVHTVQVADDVEAHLGTLVLELGEKERQQVLDGVLLADDGREAHDHARQRRLDVLIRVVHELLHVRQHVRHDERFARVRAQIVTEVLDAAGGGGAHLGLVVAQQVAEGGDQLALGDVHADRLLQLDELVGDHVAHAPRLVVDGLLERRHQVLVDVVVLEERRDDHARLDGQQAHRVLLVLGERVEQRYELVLDVLELDHLDELAELGRRRAPHHRRVVAAQVAEERAQLHLGRVGDARVAHADEAARRRARSEPVALRQPLDHGEEVLLEVDVRVLGRQQAQRVDRLVAHHRLLHRRQALQRTQQTVHVLGAADELRELAELLGQREQHLVLVVDGLCNVLNVCLFFIE